MKAKTLKNFSFAFFEVKFNLIDFLKRRIILKIPTASIYLSILSKRLRWKSKKGFEVSGNVIVCSSLVLSFICVNLCKWLSNSFHNALLNDAETVN